MNRRQLMTAAASAIAGYSLPASVKAVESEPMPLCLVVMVDASVDLWEVDIERLKNAFAAIPNCPPVIIMPPGVDVKAMSVERADVERLKLDMMRQGMLTKEEARRIING